jgi:thioredoxin-dependent peroxiredoxin
MTLQLNTKAPDFDLQDQNSTSVSNQNLLGTKYILFFYGQDDTPTCNKQVFGGNDAAIHAEKAGYTIYGVSPDSVKKHKKFIEKYNLSIHLLSDPSKKTMYDYNSYGPKIFMGKEVNGVYRTTFFIDEEGRIKHIIEDVKAADQGNLINAYLANER